MSLKYELAIMAAIVVVTLVAARLLEAQGIELADLAQRLWPLS